MKMKRLNQILAMLPILALVQGSLFAQISRPSSFIDPLASKSFVENKGQFDQRVTSDHPILYGYEGDGQQVFLSENKVYFNLYRTKLHVKSEAEKAARAQQKKQGFESPEAFTAFEKAGHKFDYSSSKLVAEWINANPNAEILASEQDDFIHTYEMGRFNQAHAIEGLHSFQAITYRDIYPNIDIEYRVHPISGIKYSIILHPHANVENIRLLYSLLPRLNSDGSISTNTKFGDIIDHKPLTFYQNTQTIISSAYVLKGNEIGFSLGNYDQNQTVVIDPWTELPNDPGSNWNCAWECETDALGNAYAIFGAMPMQLRKYNAAGAIQWTYNTTYDTTSWLGTFVTDDAGNSYVTNGSTAAIRKVSPAGGLIWSVGNITGQLLGEFWNIAFNCDQSKLIVGGTGGTLNPEPYIFDVNPVNGALLGSIRVHQSTGLFSPSEVRAITATENAKYYWLSNDSIGFLSQGFANCPSPASELIADNNYGLSYKCENWRYNNTGIEAIAYFGGFIFINRGNRIDKRALATANIVATAPIPGGAYTSQFGGNFVENSGIIIDNTGRIFVGSRGSVSQFDVNLNLLNTFPVSGGYNVYDVDLTSSGQLIACGATGNSGTSARTGTVESLGNLGAAPFVMPCCDASICPVGTLCDNAAPITLTPTVTGGTWTSTAPGFNSTTGVFDPSVAGIGTYTFFYSLACGIDSIVIEVVFCAGLSVCVEANGDLTVSGGAGPYTWDTGTMVSSCPFGPGSGCNFLTHAVSTLTWTQFATGQTVTPPLGTDTLRVQDGTLEFSTWDINSLLPCTVLPVDLVQFQGKAISPRKNLLTWKTNREFENRRFTIEASADSKEWRILGQIGGSGTMDSAKSYELLDSNAFSPISHYRLTAMDINGNHQHLGNVIIVSIDNQDIVHGIHPNPANNQVAFNYIGKDLNNSTLRFQMVNMLGQIVLEKQFEELKQNKRLNLDVSNLAEGVYELQFSQGSKMHSQKLVILH